MSFINPIFLFAISAAVLPVLYHLVRKLRAKKVVFSSLMFLKATPKELIKRRRFRDLLLMAIRAFIFGLLALAFARPFLPEEQLSFIPQQEERSVVILVDNSYSMQYGEVFEAARAEVLDRIDAAGPEDEFSIIAFAEDPQQLTPLTDDLALHRSVLGSALAVSNRTTDFYKPLRLAEEVLQDARHEDRLIVLISDFQANGWTGSIENWKLHPDIAFEPVKVGEEGGNTYVEAFNLTQRRLGIQTALRFDARVVSEGEAVGEENRAQLAVDDMAVEAQDVPAIASSRVSFQQMAPHEGIFQGTLSLNQDNLPVDNQYYVSYSVEGRPSILVVDETNPGTLRDAFFLSKAFELGENALYTFTSDGRQRLTRAALRAYQVVFVANLNALSAAEVSALVDFVEAGGSVILSFGERTDPAGYTTPLRSLGIGRSEGIVSARSVQSVEAIIGEVDLRHPVFNLFAGAGAGAILRPRFRQYVRVIPDSSTTVLGTFDTEDPFLLESRLGQGKVLVYTSTFNTTWTDFPIHEIYVPFVYQLVKYALSTSEARRMFTVGEVVALPGQPGEEWEVRTPEDNLFRVSVEEFGTGFFRETGVPGHYAAARGNEQFFFSVNVDPRESELETRDTEEVYATVVGPSEELATTPQAAGALAVEEEEARQKLWRFLMFLVLGLFALETFLANRRVGFKRTT